MSHGMSREQILAASLIKDTLGLKGIDVISNEKSAELLAQPQPTPITEGPCVTCGTRIPDRYGDNAHLFCPDCQ